LILVAKVYYHPDFHAMPDCTGKTYKPGHVEVDMPTCSPLGPLTVLWPVSRGTKLGVLRDTNVSFSEVTGGIGGSTIPWSSDTLLLAEPLGLCRCNSLG
jgi:hypothetical protein